MPEKDEKNNTETVNIYFVNGSAVDFFIYKNGWTKNVKS